MVIFVDFDDVTYMTLTRLARNNIEIFVRRSKDCLIRSYKKQNNC